MNQSETGAGSCDQEADDQWQKETTTTQQNRGSRQRHTAVATTDSVADEEAFRVCGILPL